MSWERASARAEAVLPGRMAALQAEYCDRRPSDLLRRPDERSRS